MVIVALQQSYKSLRGRGSSAHVHPIIKVRPMQPRLSISQIELVSDWTLSIPEYNFDLGSCMHIPYPRHARKDCIGP